MEYDFIKFHCGVSISVVLNRERKCLETLLVVTDRGVDVPLASDI